jgi:hypothetical protein
MATYATRSQTEHALFGYPADLPTTQLATCLDIVKCYLFHLHDDEQLSGSHDRAKVIANQVKEIYDKASIPSINVSSIVVRVKRLISLMRDLDKYPLGKRSSAAFQDKVLSFQKLFDVCTCKCFSAGISDRNQCRCKFACKIPAMEWDFWVDQNTSRKCIIGKVDMATTSKLARKEERKGNKFKHAQPEVADDYYDGDDDDKGEEEEDRDMLHSDDSMFLSDQSSDDSLSQQNRNKYPELCKVLDRCKISNRDACMIANAVLKDLNLLKSETIIDPSKIKRQRKFWREQEIQLHSDETKKLVCIGFDGKQDMALVEETNCRRNMKEEHYVIVSFPDNKYIDHVVPESSRATDVANEIMSVVKETESTDTLQAIVCDGTNNNTGKNNGILRKIEKQLGRPLQWLVCELHTNELPFRKYFSDVDGGQMTGPATSSGVIAKAIMFDPKDIPIVDFLPIAGQVVDVPDEVRKDLSTDQLYFMKACLTVQVGHDSSQYTPFLQCCQPGNLNHARWLTKASRVLRLYMSKTVASKSLQRLVSFIVNVYGPTWFHIKCHSGCQDGAKNFFFLMKQCQQLNKQDQDIVFPVLQNNSYFAHPENVLIAAVSDDDLNVRRQAVEIIISSRQRVQPNAVRIFDKNEIKLNFSAETYFDMIDWDNCQITPPPLLSHVSSDDLKSCQQLLLPTFPCHSQAVERTVKDVSAASSKVYGHKSRHGMVLLGKKARLELPKVDTKAHFK